MSEIPPSLSLSGLETWGALGRGDVFVRPDDSIPINGVVVSGYSVVALATVGVRQ